MKIPPLNNSSGTTVHHRLKAHFQQKTENVILMLVKFPVLTLVRSTRTIQPNTTSIISHQRNLLNRKHFDKLCYYSYYYYIAPSVWFCLHLTGSCIKFSQS